METVNNSYSLWKLIKYGVPQGLILGYAFFNIFLCNLFFIIDNVDIASYPDDNTSYTNEKHSNKISEILECTSRNIFEWFFNNTMKANPDKYHLHWSLGINTNISVSSFDMENTHSQKRLDFTIDRKLKLMIMFPVNVKKQVQI